MMVSIIVAAAVIFFILVAVAVLYIADAIISSNKSFDRELDNFEATKPKEESPSLKRYKMRRRRDYFNY